MIGQRKFIATLIMALLVFAMWSSVGRSQGERSRAPQPDRAAPVQDGSQRTDQRAPEAPQRADRPKAATGDGKHGMNMQEKLLRDAYARLMRYQSAAVDQFSARTGKDATSEDYLTFELRNIRSGQVSDIYAKRLAVLVTSRTGNVLNVRPNHVRADGGPAHAYYEVDWTNAALRAAAPVVSRVPSKAAPPDNSSSVSSVEQDLGGPTVADTVARSGQRLADVVEYISYEVTIRLKGKDRVYQALALYHTGNGGEWLYQTEQERAATVARLEIMDNVTPEINTVIRDESPQMRSPWNKYVNTNLYVSVASVIKAASAANLPLIPADAPIGYLPGDDVMPTRTDARAIAPADSCTVDTLKVFVPNAPITESSGSPGIIANTSFQIVVQAIDPSGSVDSGFYGSVSVAPHRTLDSSEIAPPSSISLSAGQGICNVNLNRVLGNERGTTFRFTPAGGGYVDLQVYTYFSVTASFEGLVGHTTACGHVIASGDHFVALPSTGICNQAVVVRGTSGGVDGTTVRDVGPWFPNTPGPNNSNHCNGPNDRYWNTGGVPAAVNDSCSSNHAGIDLAEGTASAVHISGLGTVYWRMD
jgi:hypothetical protein